MSPVIGSCVPFASKRHPDATDYAEGLRSPASSDDVSVTSGHPRRRRLQIPAKNPVGFCSCMIVNGLSLASVFVPPLRRIGWVL
ncbi:hypothetical protein L596_005115 [Steinernema carpocapsae]|uniref:Uncharacterized protein n=1 Tax=Steinernema carpocapsae TaxID=34508 RepID=A0A4U8UXZ3_STECR|nr:hypothetical protein L596_005115 [Steinernema carpocapsae]